MRSFFRDNLPSSFRRAAAGLLAAAAFAAALAACSSDESTGPGDDGPLTLTKPTGGETFKVGDTVWVEWKVKDDPNKPVTAVDPMISPDDGITWQTMKVGSIPPESPNWGRYGYKIPDSLLIVSKNTKVALRGNSRVRVRVQEYTDKTIASTSKTTLSIAP